MVENIQSLGNIQIPVIGIFQANFSYHQSKVTETVHVIPDHTCPVLSRKTCVALGIINGTDKEIDEITKQNADFKTESSSLFSGLRKVKTEVMLQPDAKPHCIYTLRKNFYPPKVKQD